MSKTTLVYGIHSINALLSEAPERILSLLVDLERKDKRLTDLVTAARTAGISVESTRRDRLEKHADGANHQGVIAHCKPAPVLSESDIPALIERSDKPAFIVVLDGIHDPHNLGAVLRSANTAGVDCVIAPKDNSCGLTPTVSKVASGAAELTPFIPVTNLARTLKRLQDLGVWIYGTDPEAEAMIYAADLTGPVALVLGNEQKGMRRLTREQCDHLIKLPMAGQVASLNVSVATGVCLFEVVRQRFA